MRFNVSDMIARPSARFNQLFRRTLAIFRRWLGFTLAGLLAYALLCALRAIIVLGAPLADWQWYIPLSICLTLLPLRLSWHWPSGRAAWLMFGGALVWLLAGYAGFSYRQHL